MDNNFKIPNMGSNANVMSESVSARDTMSAIVESINKVESTPVVNESVAQKKCAMCGATFSFDNETKDGSEPLACPVCGFAEDKPAQYSSVETEQEIKESLEATLDEYLELIESQDFVGAKALLEAEDAVADANADGVMLEKTKIVVHADGTKEKVKVKTGRKQKMSAAQKAALKKARKAANKGSAKKKRMKAMKVRRKKLGESYEIKQDLSAMLESRGIFLDDDQLSRIVRQEIMNESTNDVISEEDKVLSAVENILSNKGLEVIESEVGTDEDVIAVDVVVRDTEAEIYLGEISDEIAKELNAEVDYDEPEADEDDESLVELTFYVVPVNKLKESVEDKEDKKPEEDKEEDSAKNESYQMFESYAGGVANVRCRINPAFIKKGQVIFDADSKVVFEAMTESIRNGADHRLTINVLNSLDEKFEGLSGAEVDIEPEGNYFLLKSNPID